MGGNFVMENKLKDTMKLNDISTHSMYQKIEKYIRNARERF